MSSECRVKSPVISHCKGTSSSNQAMTPSNQLSQCNPENESRKLTYTKSSQADWYLLIRVSCWISLSPTWKMPGIELFCMQSMWCTTELWSLSQNSRSGFLTFLSNIELGFGCLHFVPPPSWPNSTLCQTDRQTDTDKQTGFNLSRIVQPPK